MVLVRSMASGEEQALVHLYERHGPALLAHVTRLVGDRALAEEVLQDVMLASWHAAGSFRGDSSVRTWMLSIAHRRGLNATRRASLPQRALVSDVAAPGTRDAAEQLDVAQAIGNLPPEQRATLDLVFYQGLSLVESAEVMGVAVGTVKSRLHRAKQSLRAVLGKDGL